MTELTDIKSIQLFMLRAAKVAVEFEQLGLRASKGVSVKKRCIDEFHLPKNSSYDRVISELEDRIENEQANN